MKINFKRYGLYLIRWQLSTPILALCLVIFSFLGVTWATILANLVGGLLFYWADRFIFQSNKLATYWEVKEEIECVDCGTVSRGYRLVRTKNYDRINDKHPKFRCEICSRKKVENLKKEGVNI